MAKFDIKSLKPLKVKKERSKSLFKNNSTQFFRNSKAVAEALSEAILDGDNEAFYHIFSGYLSVLNTEEFQEDQKCRLLQLGEWQQERISILIVC